MDKAQQEVVEWAVASRAAAGESEIGDICLVEPFPGGILLGAVDGLGNGKHAASVAKRAVVCLRQSSGRSLDYLINECHRRMAGTRGVVLSLASINSVAGEMTWAGVGNVEVRLFHFDREKGLNRESLMAKPGVVGYQITPVRTSVHPVSPGDILIFTSDGITGGFDQDLDFDGPVQAVADYILEQKGKENADALVLVARYLGLTSKPH